MPFRKRSWLVRWLIVRLGHLLPSRKPNYAKPHRTYSDQVQLLLSRGLTISDKDAAESFLRNVNYYRLSAYSRVYYRTQTEEIFSPGATFDQIRGLYEFDRELRRLIVAALEPIEVSVRTALAYHLGLKYGAFAHRDPKNFKDHPSLRYSAWLDTVVNETARSNELFVQHFENTYREFPILPVWAVVEIMSFGTLSKMFQLLQTADRQALALPYGIHQDVLGSWLHTIVYARNICAHHGRLWDREFRVPFAIPKGNPDWKIAPRPKSSRLGGFLFVLNWINSRGAFPHFDSSAWRRDMEALIGRSDHGVPVFLNRIGLAPGWTTHPLWR